MTNDNEISMPNNKHNKKTDQPLTRDVPYTQRTKILCVMLREKQKWTAVKGKEDHKQQGNKHQCW